MQLNHFYGHNNDPMPCREDDVVHVINQVCRQWTVPASQVDWESLKGCYRVLYRNSEPQRASMAEQFEAEMSNVEDRKVEAQ